MKKIVAIYPYTTPLEYCYQYMGFIPKFMAFPKVPLCTFSKPRVFQGSDDPKDGFLISSGHGILCISDEANGPLSRIMLLSA